MKPDDWPRYLLTKRLKSGATAYYWNPPQRDIGAGFTLSPEALGQDLVAALARAAELNKHLDSWRQDRGADKDLDLQPRCGTVDWLIERYYRSRAFEKVSKRTKPDYRYSLALIANIRTKRGGRFGELKVDQISAAVVDRLYTKHLLHSKDRQTKAGKILPGRMRRRQAELCIVIMIWFERAGQSNSKSTPTVALPPTNSTPSRMAAAFGQVASPTLATFAIPTRAAQN